MSACQDEARAALQRAVDSCYASMMPPAVMRSPEAVVVHMREVLQGVLALAALPDDGHPTPADFDRTEATTLPGAYAQGWQDGHRAALAALPDDGREEASDV